MVDSLLSQLRGVFEQVAEPRASNCQYPLADNLMTALAVFHQKDPSLLAFRDQFPARSDNMRTIYGLKHIPQDSSLRACLDKVAPTELKRAFAHLLNVCSEQEIISGKLVLDGRLLISIDGTGYFSSTKINCPHCLVKNHSNGQTTFHHQMLAAVITHPEQKNVLPVYAEPIANSDGAKKNDCERNACKRLLPTIAELLPGVPKVGVLDALYADGPTLLALKEQHMDAIICIKEGYVLQQVERLREQGALKQLRICGVKQTTVLHWAKALVLNGAHQDILVDYFEVAHYLPGQAEPFYKGAWITTLQVDAHNVAQMERCARSRWRIENETFNTLKNQNFNLEHNYGHGRQYLSTVFCLLMLLAFFVDQIAACADNVFQRARARFKTYRGFLKTVGSIFDTYDCRSMNAIYAYIAGDSKVQKPKLE